MKFKIIKLIINIFGYEILETKIGLPVWTLRKKQNGKT